MRLMRKGVESTLIITIIISFILLTTIIVSNSPNMFLNFICWLGGCENSV